jgi:hypothetical protein
MEKFARFGIMPVAYILMLLSILIFNIADLAGVWQRMMFVVVFAWLMYFLYPRALA